MLDSLEEAANIAKAAPTPNSYLKTQATLIMLFVSGNMIPKTTAEIVYSDVTSSNNEHLWRKNIRLSNKSFKWESNK